jgi:6-pyruvoyltetrahydropterin/6-carboxytetrahydropterin synthase
VEQSARVDGTADGPDGCQGGARALQSQNGCGTAHPSRTMEKIIVHSHFHTGHRQLGYPGKCKWVHGHTWRGTVTVSCDAFPRDDLDMALDFGDLKAVMRFLDHKMIVTEQDAAFLDPALFEPEGVVCIKGRGPSVENVALWVWDQVVAHIRHKFPDQGVSYSVEVLIQETENNIFVVEKDVTI